MWHKLSFPLLFSVWTCGQISSAQIGHDRKCIIKSLEQFKWPDFSGIWYEHSRYPDTTQFGEKCVLRNYFNIKDDTCEIKYSGLSKSNQPVSSYTTGRIVAPGLITVNFPDGPGHASLWPSRVLNNKLENCTKQVDQILGTDYKWWAVIHSCQRDKNSVVEKAWILTRQRNADPLFILAANRVLTQNNFPTNNLTDIIQHGCTN